MLAERAKEWYERLSSGALNEGSSEGLSRGLSEGSSGALNKAVPKNGRCCAGRRREIRCRDGREAVGVAGPFHGSGAARRGWRLDNRVRHGRRPARPRGTDAPSPPPDRPADGRAEGEMDRNAAVWDPALARRRLVEDGYCHVPGVLDPGFLRSVQEMAAAALDTVGAEHRAQWRSQGSLVALADHPPFAALIACPGLQEMFSRMGLDDTRFTSGYIISKPPGGPALFWHQDWWGWRHPISRTDRIAQIALFLYLTDTQRGERLPAGDPGLAPASPPPARRHRRPRSGPRHRGEPGRPRVRAASGRGGRAGDGRGCSSRGCPAGPRCPPEPLRPGSAPTSPCGGIRATPICRPASAHASGASSSARKPIPTRPPIGRCIRTDGPNPIAAKCCLSWPTTPARSCRRRGSASRASADSSPLPPGFVRPGGRRGFEPATQVAIIIGSSSGRG